MVAIVGNELMCRCGDAGWPSLMAVRSSEKGGLATERTAAVGDVKRVDVRDTYSPILETCIIASYAQN